MTAQPLFQFGTVTLHPTPDGRVIPYGQNIGHIISPVPQNSDQPEKTRFLTFSVGARRLWVHLVAMAAGFVNYTLRGVGSDHCENTNRGCVGHR